MDGLMQRSKQRALVDLVTQSGGRPGLENFIPLESLGRMLDGAAVHDLM
jgi:hypothetical protein